MNKCVGDMEPYIRFREKNCKLCLQCKALIILQSIQVVIHEKSQARVRCPNPSPSQSNCFEVYSTSASKKWFWHQGVMAKRIMMEVWKVKTKGSNSGEVNHKTEGSPVVDTVGGVVMPCNGCT